MSALQAQAAQRSCSQWLGDAVHVVPYRPSPRKRGLTIAFQEHFSPHFAILTFDLCFKKVRGSECPQVPPTQGGYLWLTTGRGLCKYINT